MGEEIILLFKAESGVVGRVVVREIGDGVCHKTVEGKAETAIGFFVHFE